MTNVAYPGRLALQQRVLPDYRAPFYDLLAGACAGGMSVFAGSPRSVEEIKTGHLDVARFHAARNLHLFGGPFYLCYQRGILDWLRAWDPSALIVEANPRYLAIPSAVRWMQSRGRPVIGWGLGSTLRFGQAQRGLSGPLAGFRQTRRLAFLHRFDALIAYSQRGAESYAALGFPADKIFVARNSVSPRPVWPLPARPTTFRERPNLLFVGRLQARKRLDLLLRACAQIDPQPRLVIVGEGPEREHLQKLAKEIYPSTEFAGARRGLELKPYFTEADLFVLPGTGGLAVQEAMSYGLPVVVARGDGTQDDLVRAANGWQVAPDDLEALLCALRQALADAPRLRRMGAESYRIASEEINIEKMVETFLRALNSIG
jgi:glycosyltransferase involved in cell wall biosynthesis